MKSIRTQCRETLNFGNINPTTDLVFIIQPNTSTLKGLSQYTLSKKIDVTERSSKISYETDSTFWFLELPSLFEITRFFGGVEELLEKDIIIKYFNDSLDNATLSSLTDAGVMVRKEPTTIDDVILEGEYILLKEDKDWNKSNSGIIVDSEAVRPFLRGTIRAVGKEIAPERLKVGDYIYIDLISCQMFELKTENNEIDKYFLSFAKHIVGKETDG
jgi:co-chaperonin GroES (HSP10)